VRVTVDGKTLTSPLRIVPDPRGSAPQADIDAQVAFALRIRDNISKLTDVVNQAKSVREQLQARVKALEPRKNEAPIAELLKQSAEVIKKADALEDRLHNPTAEVVYDILAMRGGTRLYSRLSPLQMWAVEGEGAPTQGMQQVLAEQEKELAQLTREAEAFMAKEVAAVNTAAAKLSLPFVIR
jgi:hypothetical protein